MSPASTLPPSFLAKKRKILDQLAVPESEYDDLSPKGSIDVGIRELIDEINDIEGCVTTSSCAGRISVFLEGVKKRVDSERGEEDDGTWGEKDDLLPEAPAPAAAVSSRAAAGVGGKGGGGRWLFVSHDPMDLRADNDLVGLLGMQKQHHGEEEEECARDPQRRRYIHFKFEPMILHILTSSLKQAQIVLSAALQSGFRESGALNLTSSSMSELPTPMVGIRSQGLALESLVGYESGGKELCNVPEPSLRTLLEISNERFVENTKRIKRFRDLLLREGACGGESGRKAEGWEDARVRRERMREEGLARSRILKGAGQQLSASALQEQDTLEMGFLDENT